MKDIKIQSLAIPDVKLIRFSRFLDNRGYFTEPFRRSDLLTDILTKGENLVQTNQSFSHAGVTRGLHFQWNPYMGKLVRVLSGRMVDVVVDIRLGSPTFGKGIMCELTNNPDSEHDEMIWIPAGFAHGNFFSTETLIEYYCTGEYSPGNEAGISPLSVDIDWSLCDERLKAEFVELASNNIIISEKDTQGLSVTEWVADERSKNFIYENLK